MGVSLAEMLRKLQVVKPVDNILEQQYAAEEDEYLRREREVNARADTWHQSFHASSFPLDPDTACARKALYGLMALPADEPVSRYGRAIMESGQNIEDMVVRRFRDAGVLLSRNDGAAQQTNFRIRAYWLSGHVDSIINLSNRAHVVEIKSKKHAHVEEMRSAKRGPDPQHRAQAMTYMWFARLAHEQLGFKTEPCKAGSILYVSRDAPGYTAEFWIDFDEDAFRAGLDRLKAWKESYINGVLLPRRSEFFWTKPPCQWCDFKKVCKADDQDGVSQLSKSHAVTRATQLVAEYDFDTIRRGVIESWEK